MSSLTLFPKTVPLISKRIVITGGPSTGKTSLINALEKSGYFCFHEVIRMMTQEAKEKGNLSSLKTNPIATVSDPMAFNEKIMAARLRQFHDAEKIDAPFAFYDRGIPDVLAYMNYYQQTYGDNFRIPAQNNRYDIIFLLPIWEEIYQLDSGRFESFEEAKQVHLHLKQAYTSLGYDVIEVAPDSVQNRLAFILNHLESC